MGTYSLMTGLLVRGIDIRHVLREREKTIGHSKMTIHKPRSEASGHHTC